MAASLRLVDDLKNITLSPKSPCFVINTIAHVPNPTEISECQECGWEMDKGTQFGGATLRMVTFNAKNQLIPKESDSANLVVSLLEKLQWEAIDSQNWHHPDFNQDNLAIVIFLNRMISLSNERNQAAISEYRAALNLKRENFKIKFEVICGFWQKEIYEIYGKPVTYEEALEHYKELTGNDREKFLTRFENEVPVPYQSLRENLKNCKETKQFVKEFRAQDAKSVYLSLVDSDTVHFNGIYSEYYNLAENHSPTVMSTGYNFPAGDKVCRDGFKIASELDRQCRIRTAQYLGFGVYYPEPNTCILIPNDKETVLESFIDVERDKGNGLECAVLLGNVINTRVNPKFLFYEGNPLITRIPDRARIVKGSRHGIEFSTDVQQRREVLQQDIETSAKIAQSHFDHFIWSMMLYINRGFTFNIKEFAYLKANKQYPEHLKSNCHFTCKSLFNTLGEGNSSPAEIDNCVTILKKLILPEEIVTKISQASEEIRQYKNNHTSLAQTAYAAMLQELFTDLGIVGMVDEIAELVSMKEIELQTVDAVCEAGFSFEDAQEFKWHCFIDENGVTQFILRYEEETCFEEVVEFVRKHYSEDVNLEDIADEFSNEGNDNAGDRFYDFWVDSDDEFDVFDEDMKSHCEYIHNHY